MGKEKGIYLRGDTYWIRYTGLDGKQYRESSKSRKLRDALNLLKLRQADVVRGEQPEILRIKNYTFRELATQYLEFCANQDNFRCKKYMVDCLASEFGNLQLKNFSLMLLEGYQTRLLTEERTIKHKILPPLATATVNRRLACIKHMFTKAADWNMVSETICKQVHKVKLKKENNKRDKFLSGREIQALLDACDTNILSITGKPVKQRQDHLKPIILFALNTGCRKEEILSLKWEQVDLVHGFVNLNKTKNGESRQIPINDPLKEVLNSLTRGESIPWVFYDQQTGKRFSDVKRSFNTACRRAGISDFVFHGLRHTFASHLVMAGVDLTTVSRLMGHKTLMMTLRYSHLAPHHLATAVNVLSTTMPISTNLAQEAERGLRRVA